MFSFFIFYIILYLYALIKQGPETVHRQLQVNAEARKTGEHGPSMPFYHL